MAAVDGEKGVAAEKEVTAGKMITLVSNDGKGRRFEVPEAAAARLSILLREMIESGCTEGGVPLPASIGDATLAILAEYLNTLADAEADAEDSDTVADGATVLASKGLKERDVALVDGLGSQAALFDLILAANFLNMDGLLDAACKKVADMMKDKTPEQIRDTFNIRDDYSEEEKMEVRNECAWAFFPNPKVPKYSSDEE